MDEAFATELCLVLTLSLYHKSVTSTICLSAFSQSWKQDQGSKTEQEVCHEEQIEEGWTCRLLQGVLQGQTCLVLPAYPGQAERQMWSEIAAENDLV